MSNESPDLPPVIRPGILTDILIVDDDADVVNAARLLLERRGLAVRSADGPEAAWVELARARPDVILLDLNFARGRTSGEEGLTLLDRIMAADPGAAVVIVTGHSGIAIAVAAMRAGASDFIIKPWNNERLVACVARAAAQPRTAVCTNDASPVRALLGESAAMVHTRAMISRIAPTMAGVLLRGPAGSGKSLAFDLIHRGSAFADQAPVRIECELLGDTPPEKLAGKTVLLDHVDRVPRSAQRGLADALEGARVVATTRSTWQDLGAALTGELIHRFDTIDLILPPLTERGDDVLLLARHFLAIAAARHDREPLLLSEEAMHLIVSDLWPDNLHGLARAMERAVLLADGSRYEGSDLGLTSNDAPLDPSMSEGDLNLERHERRLVLAALKRHAFNISRASEELGLTRAALYRRMEKHAF